MPSQPQFIFQKRNLQKRHRTFQGTLANQDEELHLVNNLQVSGNPFSITQENIVDV